MSVSEAAPNAAGISSQGIGQRTARGAGWLIASRLTARSIDFLTLMMLARLLVPQDFGLVAIGMSLVQLVEAVFDLLITQVLVRAHTVDREMEATTFTLGLLRGALLAALLGAVAWPAAVIYRDARLMPLIFFLALAPVLRGLQSPAMAHYARALNFRPDLYVEVGGKISACLCAAVLAFTLRSYWAIAVGTVAGPLVMVALSFVLAPMWPRFSLARWSSFGAFIGWTSAAQALSAVNWQLDRLLLSRFVPPAGLGAFTMASDLAGLPFQALVAPMFRPLASAFALMEREQGDLRGKFLQACALILSVTVPLALGLSLLAEPAVRLALGPKWLVAAAWLRWLAPIIVLNLFQTPFGALAMSLGRTSLFWRLNLVEMVVKLPAMLGLIMVYGVAGAIAARALAALAMAVAYGVAVHRVIGLGAGAMLGAFWRVAAAGAGMAGLLLAIAPHLTGLTGLSLALALAGAGLSGLACYGALLLALGFTPARAAFARLRQVGANMQKAR